MGDYSFDLRPLLWLGAIVGAIIVGIIWFVVWVVKPNNISVKKPLKVDTTIIIKNNKADTTFIYNYE